MKIYILQTKNSETAPRLATHLKNSESGYDYPEEKCFVINYGRITNKTNLNSGIICNKLSQLTKLRLAGLNVPHTWILNPEDFPKHVFPLLARKFKHFKGNDIIFLRSKRSLYKRLRRVKKRNFFVEYIDKKAEFRVHVLGDEVLNICQKVPSEKTTIHHPHVWSSVKGWTLINYNGEYSKALAELGKKAVNALNYDFGAVDIGLNKNGKFYIFEVNSAPRLSKTRRKFYAKFFRQKEREFSENV